MMHVGDILSRVGISCIHQSTMLHVGEHHECIGGYYWVHFWVFSTLGFST